MDEEIGRETVFVPPGWRWEPFTIYQLRSHHPGWDGLRAILEEGSIYQLVGDESTPEDGIAAVSKVHPEAILFAEDLPDLSAVEFTTKLREVSATSKLVIVGEQPESELLVLLGELGVDAVLPWQRVTPLGVFCCLMPVLQDGWKVMTARGVPELVEKLGRERRVPDESIVPGEDEPAVPRRREAGASLSDIEEMLRVTVQEETVRAIENVLQPERRRHSRQETLVFTDLERVLLRAVGRGLRVRQIVQELNMSERTVGRRIRELRSRFGADRRGQLVTIAHELGFGEEEE